MGGLVIGCVERCIPLVVTAIATVLVVSMVHADVNVPDDYDTIQEAIDALAADASKGDTVIVEPGSYDESITLRSNITLRGEETARTFFELEDDEVAIEINDVESVAIYNFTFLNAETAIVVDNSEQVDISNNVFRLGDEGVAIDVDDLSNADITNNTFFDNDIAIRTDVDTVRIENNIFSENVTAIDDRVRLDEVSFNCYHDNEEDSELGRDEETGDPLFVNTTRHDFHLKQNSPCIDEGTGIDSIDDSDADMGAYGGEEADFFPFPVSNISAVYDNDTQEIFVRWSENEAYLVKHSESAGGYIVHYGSETSGSYDEDVDAGNVSEFSLTNISLDVEPPNAPVISTVEPGIGQIIVRWPEVEGASSYRVYYGIDDVAEESIEVQESEAELTGLIDGTTYQIAVSAIAQEQIFINVSAYDSTGEESHESKLLDDEEDVVTGERSEGPRSAIVTAIPEEVVPAPLLDGEGCFIATAAYGFYDAPQVQALRDFRDRYLMTNRTGRDVVAFYYRHSPALADYIDTHPEWKPWVRALLWPFVTVLDGTVAARTALCSVVALMMALFIFRRRVSRIYAGH